PVANQVMDWAPKPVAPVIETPAAAASTKAQDSFRELVQAEIEPIRPTTKAAYARRPDAGSLPKGLREPWYLTWVEAFARFLRLAAIVSLLVVPALFLVGGLTALARTGDPKTLLAYSIGGVRVFPVLLVAASGIIVAAIFWAAPFLVLVDLWRRYRAISSRID